MRKIIISAFIALFSAQSALADCACGKGIPAAAVLPSIDFGKAVVITVPKGTVKAEKPKAAAKPVATPQVAAKAAAAVPAAPAAAVPAAVGELKCEIPANVAGMRLGWDRDGNTFSANCEARILEADATKIAALAAQGKKEFRIALYFQEKNAKCDSHWATAPVKITNSGLLATVYPWYKRCRTAYMPLAVVK